MVKNIAHVLLRGRTLSLLGIGIALLVLRTAGPAGASAPLKPSFAGPPPTLINYQGVVQVGGAAYNGAGYFKFAIVNSGTGNGTAAYWSNAPLASGEPGAAVSLNVNRGLFNVLLGDAGMTPLDEGVFAETDTYLRVWFSSTGAAGSFEALEPNQRIVSVAYALRAKVADNPGPTGPQGPTGPAGPTGPQGPAGPVNTFGVAYYIVAAGDSASEGNPVPAHHFIGEIVLSAGQPGWYAIPCDGRLLPINQYQMLFSVIGTTYGGNGTSNFAVPNLTGKVPVGQ